MRTYTRGTDMCSVVTVLTRRRLRKLFIFDKTMHNWVTIFSKHIIIQ